MGVVIVAVIFAFLGVLFYMQLLGFDRMLRSGLRKQLAPGETVRFESLGARVGAKFPLAILTFRQGYIVVTDRRLLSSAWVFPPFWRTTKEIALNEVEDVKTFELFRVLQVHVTAHGEKTYFMPIRNRIFPFSSTLGQDLIKSIEQGRLAHS
jgi:hypothetical protein